MALQHYSGPANTPAILQHIVGETITKAFIDADGRVWLVATSGYAFACAGFHSGAPAFSVENPQNVNGAIDKRKAEISTKIAELKALAPGVEII